MADKWSVFEVFEVCCQISRQSVFTAMLQAIGRLRRHGTQHETRR